MRRDYCRHRRPDAAVLATPCGWHPSPASPGDCPAPHRECGSRPAPEGRRTALVSVLLESPGYRYWYREHDPESSSHTPAPAPLHLLQDRYVLIPDGLLVREYRSQFAPGMQERC